MAITVPITAKGLHFEGYERFPSGPRPKLNIFQLADMHYDKFFYPDPNKPKRTKPMPSIVDWIPEEKRGTGPIKGPTKEYEEQYLAERKRKKWEQKRDAQNKIIDLLNRADKVRNKLNKMHPTKSNRREIAHLNLKLMKYEEEIKVFEELSGIKLDELEEGSKVLRWVNNVKRKVKKTWKKFKTFVKKNKEPFIALAVIFIPALVKRFLAFLL